MQPLSCPLSPERGTTTIFRSAGDATEPWGEEGDDIGQQQTTDALGDKEENGTEEDEDLADECILRTAEPAHERIAPYRSMLSASHTTGIAVDDQNKQGDRTEGDEEPVLDDIHRLEEKAIAASVAKFREAAGYEANFEEFCTTLKYKTVRDPDGSTREVAVGTYFNAEPLWSTMRRIGKMMLWQLAAALCVSTVVISMLLIFWFSCESRMLGPAVDVIRLLVFSYGCILAAGLAVTGANFRRNMSLLRKSWLILAIVAALHMLDAVVLHLQWRPTLKAFVLGAVLMVHHLLIPWTYPGRK